MTEPYSRELSCLMFPMTAWLPSLTSTLSMRMTCEPPLLSRRSVSTRIANVRDSRLTAVAAART